MPRGGPYLIESSDATTKYLYAIIRKPQEGKTFICLENIERSPEYIHVIVTMNTIKANNQFFERAKKRFGNNICVFNSSGTKKEETKEFIHTKDVIGVKKYLQRKCKDGIDIIVMCAHYKRFDDSILDILDIVEDSKKINKEVIIHIDEAHAYVPSYRCQVMRMNECEITHRIYMYSATPFNIWSGGGGEEGLFTNIYIVDVEAQFDIKKSKKYFGVKDTIKFIRPAPTREINEVIPDDFIREWGSEKQFTNVQQGKSELWYGLSKSPVFDFGNEQGLLSFTKDTLEALKEKRKIKDNEFSYNFIPGYKRKLTHYAIMDQTLTIYPNAIVIIINGFGSHQCYKEDGMFNIKELPTHNEPSKQIEMCIKEFPNRPVFITGFHCVGMSVTFINENTGNFDNVIFSHEHYIDRPEVLYQLCRFTFNYTQWKEESIKKIKKTLFLLNRNETIRRCLDYEKQIDKIDTELSGSLRTLDEVKGGVKVKEKKVPKERKYDRLEPYHIPHPLERVKVYDGNDEEAQRKVEENYYNFMGKEWSGRSRPSKNEDGFFTCSTTTDNNVQVNLKKFTDTIKSFKWDSNFAITKGKYKYSRVYVVYDDPDEPSEYTWIIRKMEIKDCSEVSKFWESLDKKE